jgi:NADH:ubiquinone oxidoreductase subunit F (NADH-binding)
MTAVAAPSRPGLLPGAATYSEHVARYGPLPSFAERADELIGEVERSGLGGRGGAGFPTGAKLRAVASGKSLVVVANGTEGEPASAKDKVLLRRNPHLVLDGVLAAVDAVGAEEAIVAVSRGAADLEAALGDRPGPSVRLRIVSPPERFITGEESALVHWLNGGPAKPTMTPPRPFERGVRGRPTLVQNVETLAALALVARNGASGARTVLVTLLGGVARPGVLEAELGTPISELVRRCGGLTSQAGALLVGGYFGTWVPADRLERRFSEASLGTPLGARTIAVLPEGACGMVETARVLRYLAGESAGQCGPCVFGLSAVRFLASALDVFADEISAHLAGRCTASHRQPVLPLP